MNEHEHEHTTKIQIIQKLTFYYQLCNVHFVMCVTGTLTVTIFNELNCQYQGNSKLFYFG